MPWGDVLLNAALLIAGWYGRDMVSLVRGGGLRSLIARRRRRFERGRARAMRWAVEYYREDPVVSAFPLPDGRRLGYLTRPEWITPNVDLGSVQFRCVEERSTAPVSKRAVRARRRLGQRVWNGDVYLLNELKESDGGLLVEAALGGYFQYVTTATRLTNEAIRCARRSSARARSREELAAGELLRNGAAGGQLLGFAVAFVVHYEDSWRVVIQDRSHDAGVAGGATAVLPAYVCEPVFDGFAEPLSPYRDFLRELSEELYADQHRELTGALRADWFYELAPIRRLDELREQGRLLFDIVGCGFDALTVEMHFAAIAVVTDPEFSKRELRQMTTNWEASGIRLVDFESAEMDTMIASEKMYPTSAFTLSCARRWFEAAKSDGRI